MPSAERHTWHNRPRPTIGEVTASKERWRNGISEKQMLFPQRTKMAVAKVKNSRISPDNIANFQVRNTNYQKCQSHRMCDRFLIKFVLLRIYIHPQFLTRSAGCLIFSSSSRWMRRRCVQILYNVRLKKFLRYLLL